MRGSTGQSAAKLRASKLRASSEAEEALIELDDKLYVVLSDRNGGTEPILVDRLRMFPNLRQPIVDAVILHSRLSTVRTKGSRRRLWAVLLSGLLPFLEETERHAVTIEELDPDLAIAFIRWLNEPSRINGLLRSETSRSGYYNALLKVLVLLHGSGRAACADPADLPQNPWPHAKRSAKGTVEIDEDDLRAIARRCAELVRSTSARLRSDLDLLNGPEPTSPDQSERRRVLLAIMALPPSQRSQLRLEASHPDLARASRNVGAKSMRLLLLPALIDLIPYLLLLAITFRLNESVLIDADQSDFVKTRWIGGERIVARPFKPRARRRQRLSASAGSDAVNPEQMLNLLRDWTLSLRRHLPTDAFLIYADPRAADEGVIVAKTRNFAPYLGTTLRLFFRKESLPQVTITQIRAFMLELAHRASGGDILAVRAAGGQKSLQVVADHYITGAGRRRGDEVLAKAMMRRDWITATAGRCDARRHPGGDDDAATPGWRCDRSLPGPFPPIATTGHCAAYGRCPICVRGSVDVESPRSYMLVLALLDAIERSRDVMLPEAWLGRLAPIRRHIIESVIPSFAPEVAAAPAPPMISLPTLD